MHAKSSRNIPHYSIFIAALNLASSILVGTVYLYAEAASRRKRFISAFIAALKTAASPRLQDRIAPFLGLAIGLLPAKSTASSGRLTVR